MTDVLFEGLLEDLDGLEESELRDLIERTSQIVEMTNHRGWTYLQDYLVALTTKHQTRILGGYCRDIEAYRAETGYVKGLQAALEAPMKLQERIERMQQRYEEME